MVKRCAKCKMKYDDVHGEHTCPPKPKVEVKKEVEKKEEKDA